MLHLYNGDCINIMNDLISKGTKVDAVICDPPYGTTACKWDSIIPFDDMWRCIEGLTNDNSPIILFGSEPFSSKLRISKLDWFRYDWIWDKGRGYNFTAVKHQPFKSHEIISVFSKNKHFYKPIMEKGKPYTAKQGRVGDVYSINNSDVLTINKGDRYPLSIQKFIRKGYKDLGLHPTQKPVSLMEYLIKTYTKENQTVLDFTMGSGSTGIACLNTNRNFIGIELDTTYYAIASDRINNHVIPQTKRNRKKLF